MEFALNNLFLGWLAFALAASTPGPNAVAATSVSLASGRRHGVLVAAGVAVGAILWSFISVSGLSLIVTRWPILLQLLAVAGGVYLFILGSKGLRCAWRGPSELMLKPFQARNWSAFRLGLIVTATNPKAAMLWLALSTLIMTVAEQSWWLLVLFALVTGLIAFTIYGVYAWIFSIDRVRGFYNRYTHYFEALFGLFFVATGIGLIVKFLF